MIIKNNGLEKRTFKVENIGNYACHFYKQGNIDLLLTNGKTHYYLIDLNKPKSIMDNKLADGLQIKNCEFSDHRVVVTNFQMNNVQPDRTNNFTGQNILASNLLFMDFDGKIEQYPVPLLKIPHVKIISTQDYLLFGENIEAIKNCIIYKISYK